MTYQFSPETQRQYDEMLSVLRTSLADGDADDAIGCLDALLSAHRDDVITETADALEADSSKGQQSGWTRIYKRHAADFVRSLISGAPAPEPMNEMAALFKAATEEILAAEKAEQDAARTTQES